ncbi:MAG: peptide chain release factor N(5)-glutamine methyltransferase [Pirellulales bacterium]
MSTAETWTVGRLLTWTADYLKKHGSASPRLDAEVLLAEARGCNRIDLYTAFGEEPPEPVKTAFREMVRRRAEGTPVAYLVGRKEFYSLNFEVNPDVLIPRPETEHLVVEALDRAKQLRPSTALTAPEASVKETQVDPAEDVPYRPKVKPVVDYTGLRIADVGTGSGIIAVCLAKNLPGCSVTALDISPAALATAARNAKQHGVESQVALIESDLLCAVPQARFDLIVSNPPYVSESEYAALDRSVKGFEPRTALVADEEGTAIITRLFQQSASALVPGGYLMTELSPMIVDRVTSSIDRTLYSEPTVIKDLAGLARVVTVKRLP